MPLALRYIPSSRRIEFIEFYKRLNTSVKAIKPRGLYIENIYVNPFNIL